ncbi:MAG: AAA family ATPase [Pirellulaceae bacterium]
MIQRISPAKTLRKSDSICLADVTTERLEWLWPGRIPLGKFTLLTGDPGLGKSVLTLDMTARITTGKPWPDAPGVPQRIGAVIILSSEDDLADTIKPRLEVAGADVSKVVAMRNVIRRHSSTGEEEPSPFAINTDMDVLRDKLEELGDCRLVIFDPISAFYGDINAHVNAEVRRAMSPLVELANDLKVAVVGIDHMCKDEKRKAVHRSLGSVGIIAQARSAWAVARHPKNNTRNLLLPLKANLAQCSDGLAYTVISSPADPLIPVVSWHDGAVNVTADEVLSQHPAKVSKVDAAAEFLKETLSGGPVPVTEVESLAIEHGISTASLRRACKSLGIRSRSRKAGGAWYWQLASSSD